MAPKPDETPSPGRAARAVAALVIWLGLVILLRQMPPDGREHGNFAQFIGRFHMVLLHAPIVMLALVAAFELAARRPRWSGLASAAGGLLSLSAFLCLATALDGWLLAWSGGYRGHNVTLHMWAGVFLTGACGAASLARCGSLPRRLYPALLAVTLGLVAWTGHTGGSLTHGSGYLTDKIPARVRAWLHMAPLQAAPQETAAAKVIKAGPQSVNPANRAYFIVHIAPLLERSCVSCHRPSKHKGGLLLDSYEHLMKGGEDGPAILPGNPKGSELLRRVRLPATDDDSMPSNGDKPLTVEEIEMIEHWIAAGAKSG